MFIAFCALLLPTLLAAGDRDVVAVVNGQAITAAELEPAVAAQLMSVRQREYEIKTAALKSIAFERAKAAEAAGRGISVEELIKREITDKAGAAPDEEVAKMLRVLASRLPKDATEARAVVVESLRNQRVGQREEEFRDELLARAHFDSKLVPPRVKVPIAAADASRGAEAAPVTLIEFSDFQCPYCGRSQEALRRVEKEYEGRVRLVFKQFPLEQIHKQARVAAEASVCAAAQKKFWKLHDWMFDHAATLSRDDIVAGAKEAGLDGEALARCIDDRAGAAVVDDDVKAGRDAGVQGTPAFFVNGRLIGGASFESFREVIDQELAAAPKR
jgi:protein-disulfide isomerase